MLGQVEASGKVFYKISKEKTLEQKYGNEIGFWAIAGWPSERAEKQTGKDRITKSSLPNINLTLDPQSGGKQKRSTSI